MTMEKELWIFTMRYPYGQGEPFIAAELEALCAHFGRVIVIPQMAEGPARPMPPNATVHHVRPRGGLKGVADLLLNTSAWRDMVRTVRTSAPSPTAFQARWPEVRSRSQQALWRALALRRTLFRNYEPAHVTLYSYWTSDQATTLGLLRLMDDRVRFVSRMHGFDLYADRQADGWMPWRAFHLQHVSRVFVASEAGLRHLAERHPEQRALFTLARLGTTDHGPGPWSPADTLRLVSCANLVPLKRVRLIAEALTELDIPVHWSHFGGGPERAELERAVARLPGNITVELAGDTPHAELMRVYAERPFDLFIHTSSSEGGVPVAMQEAASFGIPLLAADAGGVKEIVDERTGTLLPADPLPALIAEHLRAHRGSARDTAAFRAGVRAAWAASFNAENVYAGFVRQLTGPTFAR